MELAYQEFETLGHLKDPRPWGNCKGRKIRSSPLRKGKRWTRPSVRPPAAVTKHISRFPGSVQDCPEHKAARRMRRDSNTAVREEITGRLQYPVAATH